jgi:short-subunit dehydrogenase
MLERDRGTIINIGSIAGLVATPTYTVYAATKYGVRGFTEALRREMSIHNIEVAGIYPGSVVTEFETKAKLRRKTGISTPQSLKLTAEEMAQTIWDVVAHPRRAVITPWQMRPVVWLCVVLPGLVDKIIEWRFTRKERSD